MITGLGDGFPCYPSKVVCVGLNYVDHARELGMDIPKRPVFFYKPVSSVVGDGDVIQVPRGVGRVDYEAELAVVVGERCKDVERDEVDDVLAGFTCLNDVTARKVQEKESQWVRCKGFDSFCPIGPRVVGSIPVDAEVKCRVNGRVKQESDITNFIFSIEEIIMDLSSVMTLEKGDVVSTGTPSGVGELRDGDVVEVMVDGVGVLENEVKYIE
ncbi:fumarylacetoacetate hydrolase family protein [Methanonatronarchaeum sp. AMET-Sl]|uniref:fumarylacetoacetate hydrolase family protein n=1 Tax=Methanonatronarchaeum sp. AMET-Sl TaxID=3037654 RepID=UPI00244E13A8|nr:fumarylacetoacetate hydrolase family protein [Methanonatronarchaeum sp. AMET-Sl]WGI17535.1 fumarylacetoacetate hydrolase family protein [Methanonatronarchaeum sp. AMET-Sl]